MKKIQLIGLDNIPEVLPGDDIGQMLIDHADSIENEDVIVIAQKIISKSENRTVDLRNIIPSKEALALSIKSKRDARFCEVIIREAQEVLEVKGKVIVTKMPNGMIITSSGIDRSNIDTQGSNKVILLPVDPDLSAKRIRDAIKTKIQKNVAVIINDSLGHPDREGSTGKAIGFNGIKGLETPKGVDRFRNKSNPTINLVDELASAASILMGQSDQGLPVVIIRGVRYSEDDQAGVETIIVKK